MSSRFKLTFLICLALVVSLDSTVLGQQNKPQQSLTARQEAIVPVAALAGIGDQVNLKSALGKGLDAGLTINEIKEILVQLYAYAGFPRSLNAISTFQIVVNDRKKNGKIDIEGKEPEKINFNGNKYQFGMDTQAKLTGKSANSTQAFVPVIDTFLKEHLFGDIFGRNNLDYQSREIATISILATIGGADAQLRSHLSVGRNTGLTEGQLRGIATKLDKDIHPGAGDVIRQFTDAMFGSNETAAKSTLQVTAPTFSKGSKVSNGNFTGDVWVSMLTNVDAANSTSVGNVTFAPKARSNWHLHPSGQVLLITDGIGYYQEKGQSIRLIRKGDVIKCPANVAHWHGASPDSSMSHLALGPDNGKGAVTWQEKVTDEEYSKLN
jgi:4-carboxymuconolactone decarboxylase